MTIARDTALEQWLGCFDETHWTAALEALAPAIHPVDRNATAIWFAFFPLELARALDDAPDPEELARTLLLKGRYRLADQVDSSHRFLYGHRYWPEVRKAVIDAAVNLTAVGQPDLASLVLSIGREAARRQGVDASLVVGITAVALMTLTQAGLEGFRAAPGVVTIDARLARRSPDKVLAARTKADSQGIFGFLKGVRKTWTVTFDESDPSARFSLIEGQQIATAAAHDKRDYRSREPRCTDGEGPIPVQCRSASCGTCWVGVLGGAEKLAEVNERDERRRMREFGYLDTPDPRPIIRLACQAKAHGAVSIVIPSWNGVFGRYLRNRRAQYQAGS